MRPGHSLQSQATPSSSPATTDQSPPRSSIDKAHTHRSADLVEFAHIERIAPFPAP
ncbi:hypothetical protein [Streptomyces sp. NPDC051662]|uniref:hypothetical protein n=1 Tax=Streptomyces sp. NPDC051662 TaxID=3154750 RepID=UPI00343A8470